MILASAAFELDMWPKPEEYGGALSFSWLKPAIDPYRKCQIDSVKSANLLEANAIIRKMIVPEIILS